MFADAIWTRRTVPSWSFIRDHLNLKFEDQDTIARLNGLGGRVRSAEGPKRVTELLSGKMSNPKRNCLAVTKREGLIEAECGTEEIYTHLYRELRERQIEKG